VQHQLVAPSRDGQPQPLLDLRDVAVKLAA
jgi:hypothetical protein